MRPQRELRTQKQSTVLTCVNAAGTHKCRLLNIKTSAKSCEFKVIKTFPTLYKSNKTTSVTRKITKNWFAYHFVPEAIAYGNDVSITEDAKILLQERFTVRNFKLCKQWRRYK